MTNTFINTNTPLYDTWSDDVRLTDTTQRVAYAGVIVGCETYTTSKKRTMIG